jgi:UDP-N-acetylglucosamine 2-epimerase
LECKIVTIAGNRPEIIKLSELVKSFDNGFQNLFIYSGQHYSKNMSDDFFKELDVKVDHNLNCCTSNPDVLTKNIKDFLIKVSPKCVILYGDTNTSLSAALAARMINCKIIHVEAGLRCFDQTIVEERNRIKIDSISDYLYAPTELNKVFLKFENVPENKIRVTGNLIADVCKKYSYCSAQNIINDLPKEYLLLTMHRQENVDNARRLRILADLLSKLNYTIVFPIHPRTRNNLNIHGINLPSNVKTMDPVGYGQFMYLLNNSNLVLTDSGGVQEEAVVLKKPCITLRNSTERQETLLVGANRLFYPFDKPNAQLNSINNLVQEMMSVKILTNPYGEEVTKKMLTSLREIVEDNNQDTLKQKLVAIE